MYNTGYHLVTVAGIFSRIGGIAGREEGVNTVGGSSSYIYCLSIWTEVKSGTKSGAGKGNKSPVLRYPSTIPIKASGSFAKVRTQGANVSQSSTFRRDLSACGSLPLVERRG